ncbi:MAG: molybdopterin molybdenumtransferase MoeA, partial [Gammaproteobacteria bacterium]|nr:molybdopterin molybdenumtransferase MoeA [Gammaproteobacteria bacterium]
MLNPEEAYRKLIASIEPLGGSETVETRHALGRFAAEDVLAPVDLPPFDASAMDGYAVAAHDLDAAAPFEMRVVGASVAGGPSDAGVGGRDAIRILTGAVLPEGADAIVLQEDTERRGDTIVVTERPRPGQHVRTRGHDIARGDRVVAAGTRLDAYRLSWLTACGIGRVAVRPRVRVAVFATGAELVEVGETLGPGQIYES